MNENRAVKALLDDFEFLRAESDLRSETELVARGKRPIRIEMKVLSEAKAVLKSKIKALGGNAALNFTVEKSGGCGSVFLYSVQAVPALVVPIDLPPSMKAAAVNQFNDGLKKEESAQKEVMASPKEWRIVLYVLTIVALLALVEKFFS